MLTHLKWLTDTGQTLTTKDGKSVKVFEFRYLNDPTILSAWAEHFRSQYCCDSEIDVLKQGTGLSRKDYLNQIVFPDQHAAPGPSIRSGDFAEILIADYLEYILKFWVPRTRYTNKTIRNESTKGSDIIGFKFLTTNETPNDILIIFEVKAQFSGSAPTNRLQDAITDSIKDEIRKAESLNAIKRYLYRNGETTNALKVERFQNKADHPYKEISGAAALFSTTVYNQNLLSQASANEHPNRNNLMLILIKGNDMMSLVHELFRRAADEA